jgi:hypothetical protein
MILLAAEQRGIIRNFFHSPQAAGNLPAGRQVNPNDPTPALPLEGEGTGGVLKLKYFGIFQETLLLPYETRGLTKK